MDVGDVRITDTYHLMIASEGCAVGIGHNGTNEIVLIDKNGQKASVQDVKKFWDDFVVWAFERSL